MNSIKRCAYDWSKKLFGPETSEVGINNDTNKNSKGCGEEYDDFHSFFKKGQTTWGGENETIECLKKIMEKVSEYVYLVVVGYVQSGKSALIIYYSSWVAKKHNMNVIIMLRNQTVDIDSLERKFRNFKKEKKLNNSDLEIIPFAKKFNNGIEEMHEKLCESKKVFIILGNSEQLGKINDIIRYGNENASPINPFVLVIDELDLNEKVEATKFYNQFNILKNSGFITSSLGVTATALPVMFRRVDKLKSEQIIRLQSPLNYKGIQNIDFTTIDINEQNINQKVMLNLMNTKYNSFRDKNGEIHPTILLIKDERIKRNQLDMKNNLLFNAQIKKKWGMLVWNGNGMCIDLPNRNPIFVKNLNINDALQNIKENKYGKVPEYIGIISGDLANRGQSFVSTDYAWHLTHMIMSASITSSGTNLIQYTRLCGCYNDDIHLTLFTSDEIQKELYAYDYYQNQVVEECGIVLDKVELKNTMTKIKLKPECIMKRTIDTKIKLKYEIISNYDKIMCGEKIDAKNINEAKTLVEKDYSIRLKEQNQKNVIIYVKEESTDTEFNEENVKKSKKELSKKYKHIRTINQSKLKSLYKNPEFVTRTHKQADVMIGNKNEKIAYYIKNEKELVFGEWFLFQSPQGIYLARALGDKEEVKELFKEHYKVKLN